MSNARDWASGLECNPTEKSYDEVQRIIDEFNRPPQVQIEAADNGFGGVYLYAVGQLLVRFEYLDEVLQILSPHLPQGHRARRPDFAGEVVLDEEKGITVTTIIEGIVLLKGRINVPEALGEIDRRLGEGIATPNQVLTVAGNANPDGEVGPCPATEPEEVYPGVRPYPPICLGEGGAGVSVYIADTGFIPPAPGTARWLAGVSGEKDPNAPAPVGPGQMQQLKHYAGHGTFVAGVVRAVAPHTRIWVEDVFDRSGSALESDTIRKLRNALIRRPDADVFHVSAAVATRRALPLIGFERWLQLVHQRKGVVCISPAGNNESTRPHWPGASPRVVSVGALALDWRSIAYFSNHGSWVDVYAPGTNLVNAYTHGVYECHIRPYAGTDRRFFGLAQWSGTSFSTPVVTGLIAARMTHSGESAEQAATSLLAEARCQSVPGTGPILLPNCAGTNACCTCPGESCRCSCCAPVIR